MENCESVHCFAAAPPQLLPSQPAEARRAGFDDGQVVEIVANTVLNVFTNYLNQVAETDIDFPIVRASASMAA